MRRLSLARSPKETAPRGGVRVACKDHGSKCSRVPKRVNMDRLRHKELWPLPSAPRIVSRVCASEISTDDMATQATFFGLELLSFMNPAALDVFPLADMLLVSGRRGAELWAAGGRHPIAHACHDLLLLVI